MTVHSLVVHCDVCLLNVEVDTRDFRVGVDSKGDPAIMVKCPSCEMFYCIVYEGARESVLE